MRAHIYCVLGWEESQCACHLQLETSHLTCLMSSSSLDFSYHNTGSLTAARGRESEYASEIGRKGGSGGRVNQGRGEREGVAGERVSEW